VRCFWIVKTPILVVLLVLLAASPAVAFDDLKTSSEKDIILQLKKTGLVSGVSKNAFAPQAELTVAHGVALLVKGFRWNLSHVKLAKPAKASDYFSHVPDKAWYAQAFVTAKWNGLDLANTIRPQAKMTREQFADLLYRAAGRNLDVAFIELFVDIADGEAINDAYMSTVQKLLISKIVALDEKNRFRPQESLTRGTAAGWLYRAIEWRNDYMAQ
jgi:hypothetical protein